MTRPFLRALAAVTLAAALAVPAAAERPAPSFEVLNRLLTHVAVPDLEQAPCVTTVGAAGRARRLECGREETDGVAAQGQVAPDSETPYELRARATIQTPRWYFSAEPLAGGPEGRYLRVHGYGDVAAMEADGSTAWNRGSKSFFQDWQLEPYYVPFVSFGAAPLNPFALVTERPYAVGDLTGDGRDDVVVAHWVVSPEEGGASFRSRAAVTVLDGADGTTLWHRLFPGYVTQVLLDGDLLIVGNETGDERFRMAGELQGEDGTRTARTPCGSRSTRTTS
jgi:hypothetical protein